MSLVGIVLIVVGVYLALKVAGFALKLAMCFARRTSTAPFSSASR